MHTNIRLFTEYTQYILNTDEPEEEEEDQRSNS